MNVFIPIQYEETYEELGSFKTTVNGRNGFESEQSGTTTNHCLIIRDYRLIR